jgi:DNA-binding MurR/RpiR family transcriptional regulator
MTSPVSRAAGRLGTDGDETLLHRSVALRVALVERLAESVPPSEFEAAVALLATPCREVVVSGGYFSRHVAQILTLQLDQLVPDVRYAAEPLGRDIGAYLGLGKDSAVVIFDLRRYELPAKGVASLAKQRGASVVVITDEGLSPAADEADVVLPVAVDGTPFDSFAGLLVLVESLVEGVFQRRGEPALARMRQWEESVQIHRAFRAGAAAVPDGAADTGEDEA